MTKKETYKRTPLNLNEQRIMDLMRLSITGLEQAFIFEAIRVYSQQIIETKAVCCEDTFINAKAWMDTGKAIINELERLFSKN